MHSHIRYVFVRSVLVLGSVLASAACGGASEIDAATEAEAAATGELREVKIQASGDVFVKKGSRWIEVMALQSFEPALPGAPGDARIARDGAYEFITFDGARFGRLKDLATGAVVGMSKTGEGVEADPDRSTSMFQYFSADSTVDLAPFAPADSGSLTRPVSGASAMGTLPSVANPKKAAFIQDAKARLSRGTYRGVSDSGESPCEVVATPDPRGENGIGVEIFTLANGARRRLSDGHWTAEYVDGGIRVESPRKIAFQLLATTLFIDESQGLRVEVHEVLGAKRVCKDLAPL